MSTSSPAAPGPSGSPADPVLQLTSPRESLAWIRPDVVTRLLPFTAAVAVAATVFRPRWLGLSLGDARVQLAFGIAGLGAGFVGAALVQRRLTRRRGAVRVPAGADDAVLQGGYYVLNAAVEEAFFRGLLQGGLGALGLPVVGFALATAAYVGYHRLGRWPWPDVLATALVGVPAGLAFWLLPGPPSLLGVTLLHLGATCGFLGPGPYLLRRLRLLSP